MKNQVLALLLVLTTFVSAGQEQHIETKSVSIQNIITFIVDHIDAKSEDLDDASKNLIFLLQTPVSDLNLEDKIILKQAFKVISERLSEEDYISIITYSGFNGIALEKTPATDLKKIIHSLDDLKSSITTFHNDGIDLAYSYAATNYEEDADNIIIMIRNPSASISKTPTAVPVETLQDVKSNTKNNAVLLTAISLLPQIISVIKD
ncbi:hypothetical protein [Psychroserpens sp. MEBiC05023]